MLWLRQCCKLVNISNIFTVRCYVSSSFDAYKILNIPFDATETTIKNAYYRLAMEYHPDRNPSDEDAKEKFENIQNAYRLLMEKIAHSNTDETENEVPYSLTLSPLAVETHPVPTLLNHPHYKTLWIFVTLMLFITALKSHNAFYLPPAEEDIYSEKVIKREIEEFRNKSIVIQERVKIQTDIGREMNEALQSFKPR